MSAYVQEICKVITLTIPLLVPGIALIVVLKMRLLRVLDIPLDLGFSVRGKRIFGDNKTYKGIFVMLSVASITTNVLYMASNTCCPHFIDPIFMSTPLQIGLLYAFSYVLGELINSFIKRQLNIPEGVVLPSIRGIVQTFFDLSDGIMVTGFMLSIFTPVTTIRVFMACCVGLIFHYCTDLAMKKLRLKK